MIVPSKPTIDQKIIYKHFRENLVKYKRYDLDRLDREYCNLHNTKYLLNNLLDLHLPRPYNKYKSHLIPVSSYLCIYKPKNDDLLQLEYY